WLPLVHLSSLTITGAADTLSGDAGDDQLVGDSQVLVTVGVGANPLADPDALQQLAGTAAGEGPADVVLLPFAPDLPAGPGAAGSGFATLNIGEVVHQLTLRGASDVL